MKKGFTIIEFMICLSILAILAAVAIPQYQEYQKKKAGTESAAPEKGKQQRDRMKE